MASEVVNLKAAGLQTNFQSLMEISPGALLAANNTVINRDGIIEPRRGFKVYPKEDVLFSSKIKQLIEYKGVILSHVENKLLYDSKNPALPHPFVEFSGNYEEPSSYRMKYAEAKGNLYFTTTEGVKKISVKNGTDLSSSTLIEDAGGPKASTPVLSLVSPSSPSLGFLANNQKVSYRILWVYTDANENLIFGSPSTSATIENNSGSNRDVQLNFQIPYDVYAGYKYRVYRSEASTSPTDEMRLVVEKTITSGDFTPSGIQYTDSLVEESRISGVPLYTNEYSGEGLLKANEPPPASKDIALFKGHMFYANTRTRHLLNLELILNPVAGQTFVIQSEDGITNTYTFTSGATDYILKLVNINVSVKKTIEELSKVINGNSLEVVSAYYISSAADTTGKIILQRKDVKDKFFKIYGTVPHFIPILGTTYSNTTVVSTAEKFGNRLYFSKYQEHEAVPLLNYIDIGSRDQEILRIVSLRESLFILKGDGVFKLAGDPGINPTWDVGAFDNTSILKAPDSAVLMGNNCYYFSNQGVVRLNETALEVISNPIKNKLIPFIATNSYLPTVSFSVGYESENAVLFWTVGKKTDTQATTCYRYNASTNTWTEWKITKTCGIVDRVSDKLYLGAINEENSDVYYVEEERKNFDRFDYADREYNITLIGFKDFEKLKIETTSLDLIKEDNVLIQEQWVTIYQFNNLLKRLDLDTLISNNGNANYYQNLKMEIGDNLNTKLTNLANALNFYDTTSVSNGGSLDYSDGIFSQQIFEDLKDLYNDIIDKLNSSAGVLYSNYVKSEKIIKYEVIIKNVDLNLREVNLTSQVPFMQGAVKLYKGIRTEIEYAPQHAGDPSSFKQFSAGTFIFQRRSFYSAKVGYNSDISDNYEEISFIPKSSGIWGDIDWGIGSVWGGQGDQSEIRTLIPLKKQRCRFLGCKFIHNIALESYELYGLTLSVRIYTISDRDYR